MGDTETFDLMYDRAEVVGATLVECRISQGPRATDATFDPQPGDWLTVGDHETPGRRGRVLRRDADHVWIRLSTDIPEPRTDCVMCGAEYRSGRCVQCGRPQVQDTAYVDDLEVLAREVVNAAYDHFDDFRDTADEGPELQRAVVRLANRLRQYHYEGDGCLDDELPVDVSDPN